MHTYVPCSGLDPEDARLLKRVFFDAHMNTHMKWVRSQTTAPVLWSGDMNVARRSVDVYDGTYNPSRRFTLSFTDGERQRMERILESCNLRDAYLEFHRDETRDHFTWFRNSRCRRLNRGWRIDYYMADPRFFDPNSRIRIVDVRPIRGQRGSDHVPNLLEMLLRVPKSRTPPTDTEPRTVPYQSLTLRTHLGN